MEINFENRMTIIIPDKYYYYTADIQKYFLDYFNAIDTDSNVLDFTEPSIFKLKDFDIPVWLTGFTESVSALKSQYIDNANLSKGDIVIDCGAFMGITAMLFSDVVGEDGKVISIEADPINYKYAKENIQNYIIKNSYGPILLNYALWDSVGNIEFSSESNMGSSAIEYVGYRAQSVLVNTITLSEIANKLKLNKVDYVKLDIEGAETKVINDSDFFSKYHPKLFIELHDIIGDNGYNMIINKLNEYGYRFNIGNQNESKYKLIEAAWE